MDCENIDLEDLIDILGVYNLEPTYHKVIHISPS